MALVVGGVAAISTWSHIVSVARRYGEPMASWLPVSIDGLMVVGVLLAADNRASGRPPNPGTRTSAWVGAVLSIAAQLESARPRGGVAMALAVIPSFALILAVEALVRRPTRSAQMSARTSAPDAALAIGNGHTPGTAKEKVKELVSALPDISTKELAAAAGVTPRHVRRVRSGSD